MATAAAPLAVEGYSYPVLLPLVRQSLRAGSSVLLRGNPGVGKSSLANELAECHFKLPMKDIRLAQKDPAELSGVYMPNRDTKRLELFPPDWVADCCEKPHFLFLDEINAGVTKLHQAAAYQIILEHRVGPFTFHPETVVMAAGNLEEDEALAVPMSSALQNRFRHFIMRVDCDAWLRWAASKAFSPDVMAFIGTFREPKLYCRTGEYAYPSPRSWADAAKIENMDVDEDQRRSLIASCVGSAMTNEFFQFLKLYRKVDVPAIIQRGEIPALDAEKNISFVYALTFAVGHLLRNAKVLAAQQLQNLYKLMTTPGFKDEFQILLVKNIENTAAFKAILNSKTFDPIKIRLTKIVTATE